MSKGLRSWVRANWVDIANPKKGGGFPKCGRSKGEKRRKGIKPSFHPLPSSVRYLSRMCP